MKHYLTIDYEEWYQGLTSTSARRDLWHSYEARLKQQTEWLLQTLANHNIKATFFILGVVAREEKNLVRQIAEQGHEIGLHGDVHAPVYKMNRRQFHDDLARNYDAVAEAGGKRPTGYRAAYASLSDETKWIWAELQEKGLLYDSSVFPIKTPLYGMPNAPRFPYKAPETGMVEIPITTRKMFGKNIPFSGGFYSRILPEFFIRKSVEKVAAEGQPTVFYFHPWEFDETHPKPDCVTSRERLSHYGFLKGNSQKFERLIKRYEFDLLENFARNFSATTSE